MSTGSLAGGSLGMLDFTWKPGVLRTFLVPALIMAQLLFGQRCTDGNYTGFIPSARGYVAVRTIDLQTNLRESH